MPERFPFVLANGAWLASCLPARMGFRHALHNPAATQSQILARLLQTNADSAYGRKYNFKRLRTVHDFQNATPLTSYEDLAPWIERIKAGESNVLTAEPVLMFEKTSGSADAAKYIPYTASLRHEFQRAIGAWIFDLYSQTPGLSSGNAYWCITPLAREREKTRGGLGVGFETDAEYFGQIERWLLRRLLAAPNELARITDLDTSLYATCRFLLQSPELTFISVWNPSFLTIVFEFLQTHAEQLLADLRDGALRPQRAAGVSPADEHRPISAGETPAARSFLTPALQSKLRADPKRAALLHSHWRKEGRLTANILWPRLKLISCWTDASAKLALPSMQKFFPGVQVQGKGLLATEGVVSIPLVGQPGGALAVTSHFYEFIADDGKRIKLGHELEAGEEYTVVITTGGGLWRYKMGDRIRVVGFAEKTPLLEFVGREDSVSDLRGEKLSAAFVGKILDQHQISETWAGNFIMLAPVNAETPFYTLFVEGRANAERLAALLDCALRENPHYDYCRRLGQLDEPAIFQIEKGAYETYLRRCESLGQRAGAIKPTPLHKAFGWENSFTGKFLSPKNRSSRRQEAHSLSDDNNRLRKFEPPDVGCYKKLEDVTR